MTPIIDVRAVAERLAAGVGSPPGVVLVLGSGLGAAAEALEGAVTVPFTDLPGYPPTTVEGHRGRYVAGRLGGEPVLLQCGRFHLYEGASPDVMVAPVRVAAAMGAHTLILTSAAGAIRPTYEPGDLVVLEDHVNWMFGSPLVGPVREAETRFPDMSAPYDPALRALTKDVALSMGVGLEEGVYAAVPGPQYETRAEVRALARLGADVVGMSTVPEVLAARALGLRCLAISVVTNKATGLGDDLLRHGAVIARARDATARLVEVLKRVVPRIVEDGYAVSTK